MNSISKNSVITFIFQLLIFTCSFASSVILARVLGPAGRGTYALIILVALAMQRIGSLGIEVSNIYFTGSKRYEIRKIVLNSLESCFLIGIVLIIIFAGVSILEIFKHFMTMNKIVGWHLWLVVLSVPLALLLAFLNNILLGKEEIILYNIITLVQPILQFLALVLFLLVMQQGLIGALYAYVFALAGTTSLVLWNLRKYIIIGNPRDSNVMKDSIRYGIKAYWGNLAQFLNYRLDMLLVAAFLSPSAVGLYSVAVMIAEKVWMLPSVIATVIFPRISYFNEQEANELTPCAARHTLFITFIISFILALAAYPFIKFLFGKAFIPSVLPLIFLLPGVIALSISKILTADMAGRGMPQFGTYGSLASLAVNFVLNLYLIPRWGIQGAAVASSISYVIAAFIVVVAFVKISGQSLMDILLIKQPDFIYYKGIFNSIKTR